VTVFAFSRNTEAKAALDLCHNHRWPHW